VGEREAEKLEQEGPEFQIDELFEVPGVGTVCGGLVTQGFIVENMPLAVGPFDDGKFKVVKVSSIRRNKAACR
jgi:elongation factor 1-alpha